MWLFTQYGFFSVVNKPVESERIVIRSRSRTQLETLIDAFTDDVEGLNKDDIISYDDPNHRDMYLRDYEHRIYIHVESWVALAACLASDVTYDNFKSRVSKSKHTNLKDRYLQKLLTVYCTMEDESRDWSKYDEALMLATD